MGDRIDGATARAITVDTTSSDTVTVNKGDTLQPHHVETPTSGQDPVPAQTAKSGLPAAPPPDPGN